MAVVTSSMKPVSHPSVSAGNGSAVDAPAIWPHSRPPSVTGAPTTDRTPARRTQSATGPEATLQFIGEAVRGHFVAAGEQPVPPPRPRPPPGAPPGTAHPPLRDQTHRAVLQHLEVTFDPLAAGSNALATTSPSEPV